MKAQTSRAPENPIPVSQQVTPVIIKIGGGDEGTAEVMKTGTYNISIDSDFMTFHDQSGDSWQQASTKFTGRIHELTLEDGNLKPVYCKVLPQSNALTTIEVTFETATGTEKLQMEEKQEGNDFLLEAQSSSIPFNVTQPTRNGGWKASNATFSGKPIKVTLKQTTSAAEELVEFEYLFNHSPISLNLDFHSTE